MKNQKENKQCDKSCVENTILIIVKGHLVSLFDMLLNQIQSQLENSGYTAGVHFADDHEDEVQFAYELSMELEPSGIIFLGGNAENFQTSFHQITIPCVSCTLDAEPLEFDNLASVSVDDFASGKIGLDYLFSKGHTKIGILTKAVEESYSSQLRLMGAQKSYRKHDVTYDIDYVEQCNSFTMQEGYTAATKLIERHPDITAIFAAADIVAIGAMRAIVDKGLSVPGDISVLGFDGIDLTDFTIPRLTTLVQPIEKIGMISVALLLRMITEDYESDHIHFTAEILEKESIKEI